MFELWENGSYLEQAVYLGRVLLAGTDTSDVVLLIGCGHLTSSIAYVQGKPASEIDAELSKRFPTLKGKYPPRF